MNILCCNTKSFQIKYLNWGHKQWRKKNNKTRNLKSAFIAKSLSHKYNCHFYKYEPILVFLWINDIS